jgi:hypothetical protein
MEARVTKVARVFAGFLEILGEPRVASKPGEGALDHAATRQDDKALYVVAPLDDLQAQQRDLRQGSINLPGVVAAIGQMSSDRGSSVNFLSSKARIGR